MDKTALSKNSLAVKYLNIFPMKRSANGREVKVKGITLRKKNVVR